MDQQDVGKQMQDMLYDSSDLFGALSGYGGHCPEGIPVEFGLISILAAFGAAFGILYRVLTLKTGRRKRRDTEDAKDQEYCEAVTINGFFGCKLQNFMKGEDDSPWFHIADLLWHGE